MKKIFIFCALISLSLLSDAQTLTVLDKENHEPLDAVTISSVEPKVFTTTNTEGQADISAFTNAARIDIRKYGYESVVLSYSELEATGFRIFMKHSTLHFDQVVVSATKWVQPVNRVPGKVIHISPKDVQLQNPQTAADLLGSSGEVFIQKSQQGGGSPMIRGFATNRLLYTIDGVRLNTAIFRGGNIQNVINMDPFTIESTEVLFGPGSVMYGSDAIGGVMSFQTVDAEFSLNDNPLISGKAVTRFSSANLEQTVHFDVNVGWKKWAMISSFSYWNYDHLRQGKNGPDDYIKAFYVQRLDSQDHLIYQDDPLLQVPSAYSQFNFMQKVRFKPNEHWDFQYGFHYSETSPYGRYDRHNRMRNGTARYAEWNYGPQKWMMHNLSAAFEGDNPLFERFTLRLANQKFEESRIDRSLNNAVRTTQNEGVDAWSVNLDLQKTPFTKNTLNYGFEYVLNLVNSTGMTTNINTGEVNPTASRYPKSTWSSTALYLNNMHEWSEKLIFQSGLRFSTFMLNADFSGNLPYYPFSFTEAGISNNALNGSAGLVYKPLKSLDIRFNFGTAFRSPNVDDVGKIFDSEPGTVTIPNPNLKAEYAYNIDFGIAKRFGDYLQLDFTAFYTLLENAMVRRDFQLNGMDSILYDGQQSRVQAIQNAAQTTVYGIQAGLELKLSARFSFYSRFNFQTGEEELDDGSLSTSRHAAPMFGVSRLQFNNRRLTLQVYTMYQGSRSFEDLPEEEKGKEEIYAKDANGNNYSPAWYTLNFKGVYLLSDILLFSAGVENLSDQRYRSYGSGISGAGRNVVFSATARF